MAENSDEYSQRAINARSIAIAFLRRPPTERERIAKSLLIAADLPERTDEAAMEILRRVKAHGLVDDLAKMLHIEGDGHG